MAVCCSVYFEAQLPALAPAHVIHAESSAPRALVKCVRGGVNRTSPALHTPLSGYSWWHVNFNRNNMIKVCECIARLQGVRVVLDLFMGMAYSASAFARGLSWQNSRSHSGSSASSRPPELFTFEKEQEALKVGLARLGKWQPEVMEVHSRQDIRRLQRVLASPRIPLRDHPHIWVMHGSAYRGADAKQEYVYNALDVLCQHRSPLDVVMFDPAHTDGVREWLIIETVCHPQWVVISNINLPGVSWLHHRLSMFGNWRLELQGHYSLSNDTWLFSEEMKRLREWSVFSRIVS